MKVCSKCGVSKPAEAFRAYKSRGRPLWRGTCKKCETAYASEYFRLHPKDPEAERDRLRRFRKQNPEKDRAYGRKWRQKDLARSLALARERGQKWRDTHPERKIASQTRRRTRTIVTPEDIDYIAVLRRDPCSYCGEHGAVVDHIEPLHFGGSARWENLTAACQRCNASKHTRSLTAFLHTTATRSL